SFNSLAVGFCRFNSLLVHFCIFNSLAVLFCIFNWLSVRFCSLNRWRNASVSVMVDVLQCQSADVWFNRRIIFLVNIIIFRVDDFVDGLTDPSL
ncbi:hypothetical protein C0J52_01238, partial [Blattella germanica]